MLILTYFILSADASALAWAVWCRKVSPQTIFSTSLSYHSSRVVWECSHDCGTFPTIRSQTTKHLIKLLVAARLLFLPSVKAKHKTRLKSKNGEAYSLLLISHITKDPAVGGVENLSLCYYALYHTTTNVPSVDSY